MRRSNTSKDDRVPQAAVVPDLTGATADGLATIRRGVATFDRIADEVGATTGLVAMSWMQGITRQFDDTDELLRHALRRARGIDSKVDMGVAEAALAQFHMSRGDDTDGVHDLISASLEHLAEARHIASTILTLEVIAELGMHQGLPRASVELLGATAAIRSSMGTHVPPQAAARLAQLIEHGRRRLGTGFDSAFGHGSTMSLDDAVDRGRSLLGDLRQTAQ